MSDSKLLQTLRVAKKYYEFRMDRKDIAQEEGISNPTISRMLQKALDMGYVKISVDFPILSDEELAWELKKAHRLREVFVTPVMVEDKNSILSDVCRAASAGLMKYISSDNVVGTAWGNTMKCLAAFVSEMPAKDLKIVQLNGRCSKAAMPVGADDLMEALARESNGEGYIIPAPVVVDDSAIAQMLKRDSGVKEVLDLAKASDVAVFSVGELNKESIMYRAGYLDHGVYEDLKDQGAVGDIASNYFDLQGNAVDEELEKRRIGITLSELKKIPQKIAVVSGEEKAEALHGALTGGYIDVLYVDEKLARKLLSFL